MSKIKPSLLDMDTIRDLQAGGFTDIYIEFFGTVSGIAKALNNSSNPAAAANTMMKDPDEVKPGNKFSKTQMFRMFLLRKCKRSAERAKIPSELDAVLEEFRQELNRGHNEDNDFEPEQFHEGASWPEE
jgi:hypothetical protein